MFTNYSESANTHLIRLIARDKYRYYTRYDDFIEGAAEKWEFEGKVWVSAPTILMEDRCILHPYLLERDTYGIGIVTDDRGWSYAATDVYPMTWRKAVSTCKIIMEKEWKDMRGIDCCTAITLEEYREWREEMQHMSAFEKKREELRRELKKERRDTGLHSRLIRKVGVLLDHSQTSDELEIVAGWWLRLLINGEDDGEDKEILDDIWMRAPWEERRPPVIP